MNLRHIFGRNLKSYRHKKGYTQAKLAEMTDISTNYVSQLELGQHSVDFDILERLCKCLEIEAFQLFLKPKDENLPRRIDMKQK